MMATSRTQKTSAPGSAAGFSYQELYFINEIIKIKSMQSIAYEWGDDIYISENEHETFIQVKHSSQTPPRPLQRLDIELWKTFFNWCSMLSTPNTKENESLVYYQIKSLVGKTFQLVTNRPIKNNEFINKILNFKDGLCDIDDIKSYMLSLNKETKNKSISSYLSYMCQIDKKVLKSFFGKINFVECPDASEECKNSIRENKVPEYAIENIFRGISLKVKEDILSSKSNKFEVSYDYFKKNYLEFFLNIRREHLYFEKRQEPLPNNIQDFTCIKQLIDINDIGSDEHNRSILIIDTLLRLRENQMRFYQNGLITKDDIDDMEDNAKMVWDIEFRKTYPFASNHSVGEIENHKKLACNILYAIRKEEIKLATTILSQKLSHAVFYDLSDRPEIGWLYNWEDLYHEN